MWAEVVRVTVIWSATSEAVDILSRCGVVADVCGRAAIQWLAEDDLKRGLGGEYRVDEWRSDLARVVIARKALFEDSMPLPYTDETSKE